MCELTAGIPVLPAPIICPRILCSSKPISKIREQRLLLLLLILELILTIAREGDAKQMKSSCCSADLLLIFAAGR
jgi:hypothetical protein